MFELGKDYLIKMNDGEAESSLNGTLLKFEMPLIVVQTGGGDRIINTASLGFISAERDDDEIRAAKLARHEDFINSLNQPVEEDDEEADFGSGRDPGTGY